MGACGSKNRLLPAGNPVSNVTHSVDHVVNSFQKIPEGFLTVCDGCFCCNTYLYTALPEMCGAQCNGRVLCLEGACCLNPSNKQMRYCCCDCQTTAITNCVGGQCQVCCCVEGCSFPFPGRDTPVIFAKVFVPCYPSFGICLTSTEIMARV
mmetsp:Transcript_5895/g.20065  ORF Transcript_5895/g.20065 Transcript_5895/m.20065 type:complete len:151 (+) Transcript_5895:192-644(+)